MTKWYVLAREADNSLIMSRSEEMPGIWFAKMFPSEDSAHKELPAAEQENGKGSVRMRVNSHAPKSLWYYVIDPNGKVVIHHSPEDLTLHFALLFQSPFDANAEIARQVKNTNGVASMYTLRQHHDEGPRHVPGQ